MRLTLKQMRARNKALASAHRDTPPSWNLAAAGSVGQLHIYGAIGSWWGDVDASVVVPAIRDADVETLNVFINSPGGSVYDGIAIRNALRQHPGRVVITVDGLAASAASFIACAGDELIMGSNSELMIHDAWNIAIGNAEELRVVADDLDRLSQNIASMYADKAGGTADSWRDVMKAETWYSADEAVAAGLADRTDTEAAASAAAFDLSMFAHAGRASAPTPFAPAAMATNRKETPVNRAQLAAALADGKITQAQYDASIAAFDAVDAAAPAAPAAAAPSAEVAAGPELQHEQPVPPVVVNERLTLANVARRLADAHNNLRNAHDPIQAVQNALQDVIPADDDGNAFVNREDWIGQVWRATDDRRPWIDAIGVPEQMTRLKGRGWRWGIISGDPAVETAGEPTVDEYAGAKADVPSNKIGTLEEEFDSFRMAGGWDVDRAYVDFSDEEFWTSFFEAATRNYKLKSNAKVRSLILALATDTPTTDVSFSGVGIQGVLKQLRRDVRKTPGGTANRIFLGDTLFDAFEDIPENNQPLWLRSALVGLGEEEGKASVNQLQIINDPALGAKDAAVFDSRALKFKERSPFWVKAENIPKGGIDAGVFSYGRLEDHDPRLVIKRTYA